MKQLSLLIAVCFSLASVALADGGEVRIFTAPTNTTVMTYAATTNALAGKLDNSGNQTLTGRMTIDYGGPDGDAWLILKRGSDFGCALAYCGIINYNMDLINWPSSPGTLALTENIPTVPTKVSAFTNDAGYLTSYTESDPEAAGIASNIVTQAFIQERLGVYLYIGQDGHCYVHTPED